MPKKYKLTYDPRFKDKITFEVFCQMKAPNHIRTPQPNFKKVKTAFDNNMENVSLRVRAKSLKNGFLVSNRAASVICDCAERVVVVVVGLAVDRWYDGVAS